MSSYERCPGCLEDTMDSDTHACANCGGSLVFQPKAPAPVAPDVPKDAEARAISAFNLKAADLCISFRIRDDDDKQAMRAALAAYGPVARGVVSEEMVELAGRAYLDASHAEFSVSKAGMRAALEAALPPDAKPQSAEVGVITDKQVDAIIQAVMNAAEVEDGLVVACARSPVRAALEAGLSPDAKVGGGCEPEWVVNDLSELGEGEKHEEA